MGFRLGARRRSNSALRPSPSDSSDIANQAVDYAEPSYFPAVLPEDGPVVTPRSSSVSPLSSPARFPSSTSLPAMARGPSSPLVQSVSAADMSKPKRGISGMLKRARSRTPDVELIPTSSPSLSASTATLPERTERPVLGLRTRTNSMTRFMRSRSGSESTAKAASPVIPDEGEFTLVSFRSAREESPKTLSPSQEISPPLNAGPQPRTPPLAPPTRRPSSQYFEDALSSPPSSPSIKASMFQQAKAARSSASLHQLDSGSLHSGSEGPSRSTSRLDLPLPPPTARSREPLFFVPPATSRHSSYEIRPASPSPSLGSLQASPAIRESKGSFKPPKPAFLTTHDRRHSMPIEVLLEKEDTSSPSSPRSSIALPQIYRAASESQYTAKVVAVRDKARQLAMGMYAYASEKTEEAARRSTSDENTSFDAAVTTDSEDGLSDGETSETSHSRSDERPSWNSKEAATRRADASRQAQAASKRFNSSFSPTLAAPVPASASALSKPLYAEHWTTDPVSDELPMVERRRTATQQSDSSRSVLDRPRPVKRSPSPARPSAAAAPSGERSSSPMPSQRGTSRERPAKSPARPPSVPRHRSQHSASSFATLPPILTGSTSSTTSFNSPRTPDEVHESLSPIYSKEGLPVPAGIDPALWKSLSYDAQHAIEEQGRQYMAMLAKQAFDASSRWQPRVRSATAD